MSKLSILSTEEQSKLLLSYARYHKNVLLSSNVPFKEEYDGTIVEFSKLADSIKSNQNLVLLNNAELFGAWFDAVLKTNMFIELGLDWVDQIILRGSSGIFLLITRKSNDKQENTILFDLPRIELDIEKSKTYTFTKYIKYIPPFLIGLGTYYIYTKLSTIENVLEEKAMSLGLYIKRKFN